MRATRIIHRLSPIVAILLVLVLAVSACAGGAAPTPTAPAAKPAASPAAATPTRPAATPTRAPAVVTPAMSPTASPRAITGATIDKIKKAGKLTVLVDATFAPMEYKDEKGQIVGADIDVGNELAKALGVKAEFANTAWDAIFASLKAGKGDVIISSVTVTEERQKELLFSTPYYAAGQMIVVKANNTTINSADDLKGKVVGVQIDTTGQEAVEKIAGVKEIKKYDGGADTMVAVDTGKVDASVIDAMVALAYVKDHPSVKVVSRQPFTKEDIAMAIAKGNDDLKQFADQFVDGAKKDGTLDKIFAKYGLK